MSRDRTLPNEPNTFLLLDKAGQGKLMTVGSKDGVAPYLPSSRR